MREKNDKFQQRRLDGFFKAGAKACDEACAAEDPKQEQPATLEVMAMEVEMEVCTSLRGLIAPWRVGCSHAPPPSLVGPKGR